MFERKHLLIGLVALLLAFGAGFGLRWVEENGFPRRGDLGVATADIGGPFALIDHEGRLVTEKDFRGRYMLVYFGYTFCPDVCPTSLSTMAEAIDLVGEAGRKITPIFISIDPDRDTPEHLAMYVGYFHPRMVGLTGTAEQVATAARAYKAFYARVPSGDDDPGYLMDHSSQVYLMGPDGRFLTHFSHGIGPESMAEGIRRQM